MASDMILSNAQGKTVTLRNPDSNASDIIIDGSDIAKNSDLVNGLSSKADVISANDSQVKTALNASGAAPIYACRAYGYANHVTNTLINGSGISSIVDVGVGQIYFNLVVPSPNTKYTILATVGGSIAGNGSIQPSIVTNQKTTTQFDVITTGAATYAFTDNTQVYVAVFY